MPKFIYKAKRRPGELVDGTIEADHFDHAVNKIIKLGLSPIDISASIDIVAKQNIPQRFKRSLIPLPQRIPLSQIAIFTRKIYVLIDSGVPLLKALQSVLNQAQHAGFRKMVEDMYTFIENGGNFSDALARHPTTFSRLYVNMVRAGELSGQLGLILSRLSNFVEKDQEIRSQVKASLYYPLLIIVMGGVTVFVLLTFVIPNLTIMFEDFDQALPLPTMILMGISNFLVHWWLLVLGLVGGIVYGLKKLNNFPKSKLWVNTLMLKTPVVRDFTKSVELGRLARTLGTLIQSGVTIIAALESVAEILDNEVLKKEMIRVAQEVKNGSSLTAALTMCPYFPQEALDIISIGEESGHLEGGLNKLADSYERQSELAVKTMTGLLGPILILVIGSIVAFIVLAMALPIFRMNLLIK